MNRGVIAYMREGNRCAKNTLNFANVFKYYFLSFVILFIKNCLSVNLLYHIAHQKSRFSLARNLI